MNVRLKYDLCSVKSLMTKLFVDNLSKSCYSSNDEEKIALYKKNTDILTGEMNLLPVEFSPIKFIQALEKHVREVFKDEFILNSNNLKESLSKYILEKLYSNPYGGIAFEMGRFNSYEASSIEVRMSFFIKLRITVQTSENTYLNEWYPSMLCIAFDKSEENNTRITT